MPPMGPTNFAILAKGFKKQVKEGMAIGTGAGFMDLVYIMIAYGGVALFITILPASVIAFFENNEIFVKLSGAFLGSLVVIFYGFSIMKTKIKKDVTADEFSEKFFEEDIKKSEEVLHVQEEKLKKIFHVSQVERKDNNSYFFKNFITGVVFCLSSITLPASWIAIVGYLKSYGYLDSNFFTGFVFGFFVLVGTVIWFYLLLKILSKNSHKIKPSSIYMVNKVAGVILIGLGLYLIFNVVLYAMS